MPFSVLLWDYYASSYTIDNCLLEWFMYIIASTINDLNSNQSKDDTKESGVSIWNWIGVVVLGASFLWVFKKIYTSNREKKIIKNPGLNVRETDFHKELEKIRKSKELQTFAIEKNKRECDYNPLNRNQDKLPDFKKLLNLQFVEISWFLDSDSMEYLGLAGIEKRNFVNRYFTIKFINPYTEEKNCILGSDLFEMVKYLVSGCRFENLLPGHMYLWGNLNNTIQIKSYIAPTFFHKEIAIDDKKMGVQYSEEIDIGNNNKVTQEKLLVIFFDPEITLNDMFIYKNDQVMLKQEMANFLSTYSGFHKLKKEKNKIVLRNCFAKK